MPNYNSTADVKKLLAHARGRVGFKSGGKVSKKTTMGEFSKGKRLRPGIRLKGGKSFIEEYRRRLNKKADGGRIEFKKGGNITVKNEKDSKKAFQIAIEKGLKNPEDHMYMYTKDGKDFFKHIGTR